MQSPKDRNFWKRQTCNLECMFRAREDISLMKLAYQAAGDEDKRKYIRISNSESEVPFKDRN